MKFIMQAAIAVLVVGMNLPVRGEEPIIESFRGNGRLLWTDEAQPGAIYRVEWAAQGGGPWYRTFQNLHTLDSGSGTVFEVAVPMWYRVVRVTNEPPGGMVWVDGGEFVMGDTRGVGYSDEIPVHTNWVSGFWMDEMEVTKRQWDSVAEWASANGYDLAPADGEGKLPGHPVQQVSWYEAVKWCNARSQREGLAPCYHTASSLDAPYTNGDVDVQNDWVDWSASGYRLPTEAEWEKAARGARQGRLFPWGGDTIQHARANYSADTNAYPYDTSATQGWHPEFDTGDFLCTSPAGNFPANGYGLHDMAGNVAEWCWDWYGAYAGMHETDPRGPESNPFDYRVLRGGTWYDTAAGARCSARFGIEPYVGDDNGIGFRSVRRDAP